MLQHGEFLCGLSVMRCALTRIMLVPDRFFKAAVGPIGGRRGKVELIWRKDCERHLRNYGGVLRSL
jgi:hypothetical protein